MSRRRLTGNLALAGVLLTLMALWFIFYNPRIGGTSYGDNYRCLAPGDTVLNDAQNSTGGDPPADAEDIAARCRQAGERSFTVGVGAGVSAAIALAASGMLAWRNRGSQDADIPKRR